AKAAKKAGRVAAEGTTLIEVEGNQAVILEVNCETDFVTKNDTFKELTTALAKHILKHQPTQLEEALKQTMEGHEETVEEHINNVVASIGEKISLRRFEVLNKSNDGAFGAYLHMGGRIGALVVLE